MTRSTVKDWKVESIFRDMKLKGIELDGNLWLKTKFRDFQEKEDDGMRSMPLSPDTAVEETRIPGFYELSMDESYEGPSCSMLEKIVRRSTPEAESNSAEKEEVNQDANR